MPKPTINDSDRAAVAKSIKQAKLVEASRKMARIVTHTDPEPKVKAQRTRLEKSLVKWMKHHGGEAFDRPFSADHLRVIAKIETAINGGGMFSLAMPRGHGKNTILKYAMLYCMLTGRRKYVVVIAATGEMAQDMVEFVRRQMQESDTLHAHYPQVTTYARATGGKAIKAKFQLRADGKTSGIDWSKNTLVMPEVLDVNGQPYESNGAILQGEGLTGAIRGKWKDTKSGKTLRPDFVLLDDPQTRESAESESQCNMRERIITGDVLGLAGPRKKIAAVMPCTIIREGDLAARFLDHEKHPEWSGETCSLVKKWPKEQDGLWEEYTKIYRDGIACGDGPWQATTFYRVNRAAMDEGSELSWKHRIREGEISALQTAENLRIESGSQFWAEYQNAPLETEITIYDISPHLVESRFDKHRKQHEIPVSWLNGAATTIAATDINHYGLHAAHVAFDVSQSAAVLWYANDDRITVPVNTVEQQKKQIIFKMLENHADVIAALRPIPNYWFIDGGYELETVFRFVLGSPKARIPGCATMVARGYGGNYRPSKGNIAGKTIVDGGAIVAHVSKWPLGKGVAWNSHYWHEIMQRAWLGSVGSVGACALHDGHHNDFAMQICADVLSEKLEGKFGPVWRWNKRPGVRNDYGDALAMCYMGAAFDGIGTGGVIEVKTRKKYSQKDLRK